MGNIESDTVLFSDGSTYQSPPECQEEFRREMEKQSSGPSNERYAAMHFCKDDQVYVLWGDDEFREIVMNVIDKLLGIFRKESYSNELLYVLLEGRPFSPEKIGRSVAIKLRMAAAEILRRLFTVGWVLVGSSCLTRYNSVASLFFERFPAGGSLYGAVSSLCTQVDTVFVINICGKDKIQFINADPALMKALTDEINATYPEGIQRLDDEPDYSRAITVKLSSCPWQWSGETKTDGVKLVTQLMARIELAGYSFYGTADFQGTCDSIFFMPTSLTQSFHPRDYLILTMDDTDDLRVQNADHSVIQAISQTIEAFFPVKQSREYRGGYEWKLKGAPWWTTGNEAIAARHMLVRIFDAFSAIGYEHYATLDLSGTLQDKSTVIFRRNENSTQLVHAAVSASAVDKLRLIGLPGDSKLHRLIPCAIECNWKNGISRLENNAGTTEIKLVGTPFSNEFDWRSENLCRIMMCGVLSAINADGWVLVSSCDVSAKCRIENKRIHPEDLDCWIIGKPIQGQLDSITCPEKPPAEAVPLAPFEPPSLPPPSCRDPPPTYEDAIGF